MKTLLIAIISMLIPLSVIPQKGVDDEGQKSVVMTPFFKAIKANQVESYFTFGQGLGNLDPLIFESLISPYFLVRASNTSKWGATLSPSIILRMSAEESFPVKSPSYMPHLTFYRQLKGVENKASYLFLTVKHHSNGQFGQFYNDDGTTNTLTGDFSTNMLEMGLFFNRSFLEIKNTQEYYRTSIEYHINTGRSIELEGRYSFIRWHNSFRIYRHLITGKNLRRLTLSKTSQLQTRLETTWMFGEIDNARFFDIRERFTISLTMAYTPPALNDISFFVNFYTGKDYYNMQFEHRIIALRIGIQAFTNR